MILQTRRLSEVSAPFTPTDASSGAALSAGNETP
jgi:hypothetical protein